MKSIPIVAVNCSNTRQVKIFPSIRKAANFINAGNAETVRKQIASELNESGGVISSNWYVEQYSN